MTANLIFKGVHLGEYSDASKFTGPRLDVTYFDEVDEEKSYEKRAGDLHLPLLTIKPSGFEFVSKETLEQAALWIEKNSENCLVHCFYGMERSPLAVVYWLTTRQGFSWENAYKLVKEKRSVVMDSTDWLTKETRKELKASYIPKGFK